MNIVDWLRGVYGLEDDSILNAGEVEELLEIFQIDLRKQIIQKFEQDRVEILKLIADHYAHKLEDYNVISNTKRILLAQSKHSSKLPY